MFFCRYRCVCSSCRTLPTHYQVSYGHQEKKEKICIGKSYNKLGTKRADALIGWYAFKGAYNTGGFTSKKEASHFKAFMQADDTILDAFAAYGSTTEIPDWIFRQMERYVCILYQVCVSSDEIPDLRWILFAQFGKEGQQLPPTIGTLILHTSRAHYMCVVWKPSKEPCPVLPPATNYYWELTDGKLSPVLCTNSPVPEALLEL